MNKDFKNIIHKCSLFLIPILVWIAVLTIVDPFNYFSSNSFISEISKEKTAKKFNDNGNRASRKARQGEALRENLLKRKAQKRGRLKKT